MNVRLLAVCGIVSLLVVGAGGAVATGFGDAPGPDHSPGAGTAPVGSPGSAPADAPETTPDRTGGGNDSATDNESGATTDTPPFTVLADNTENCGRTCRDVTSTVTNHQNETARDVTVSTQIYAGEGTNGNPVWEGSEHVGTLRADASHTATKRITLSFGEAIAVKHQGGWITIETTVQTADRTVTLTERRQVA